MRYAVWILVWCACGGREVRPVEPTPAPFFWAVTSTGPVEPAPPPQVWVSASCERVMRSSFRPTARFEQAACEDSLDQLATEVAEWKQLVAKPMRTPDDVRALRALGPAYERLGRQLEAATVYERYARELAGEVDAPDMLATAMCIRDAHGQAAKAQGDFDFYLRTFRFTHRPRDLVEVCTSP